MEYPEGMDQAEEQGKIVEEADAIPLEIGMQGEHN